MKKSSRGIGKQMLGYTAAAGLLDVYEKKF
jgi:hypothetical protein